MKILAKIYSILFPSKEKEKKFEHTEELKIVDNITFYAKRRLKIIEDYLYNDDSGDVFKDEYKAMRKEIYYLLAHLGDLREAIKLEIAAKDDQKT